MMFGKLKKDSMAIHTPTFLFCDKKTWNSITSNYLKQKGFHISQILFQHICPTYSTHYTYINYFLCKFFVGLGIWPGKVLPKYFYLKECK